MSRAKMNAKVVRIRIEEDKAGLFYATSPELRGLLVAKPTMDELRADIPRAIREMYLVCGVDVVVSPVEAEAGETEQPWVAVPVELAKRQLEMAH